MTDPLSHVTSYTYDGDGNAATVTDPDGNVTTDLYDLADDLTSVTRPDTTTLGYTYDLDQNRTSYTNAAGNTTTYMYDPLGRVTSVTDPLGRLTASTYDPDGNLVTVTSPDGLVTTSTYNLANRLTAVSYSDGTTHAVSYSYDPAGNRISMTDASGATGYTYDNAGRLTKVTNGAGQVISYGYNADSSVTTITYPNGKVVTDGYDTAQRLTSVTDWNTNKTTFGYNNDNVLTSAVYPNGITATTGLNVGDQVTSITDTTSSGTLASFTYTRGKDAELASTTTAGTAISAPAQTYIYNKLTQLTAVNTTSDAYDKADDPTTLGGTTQTFDMASQLTASTPASGAATTYSYNLRGDRLTATTSSAVTSYGYDQANQLTSYTPATGTPTSYTYNGDGLRATKTTGATTATYAWDINASNPMLLTDGASSYLYGPDGLAAEQISSAGTPTYLLQDQLGSTRLVTSSTGAVTATYTYDAYGNIISHTGTATTPLLYAGQYQDTETGYYYLQNRYYDPATSQYLTVDPLVSQTQALYSYVNDNPLNGTDPTGLMAAPDPGGGGNLTIGDIIDDPWILEGLNPDDVLTELGGVPPGFRITTLGKGSHAGQGWALRKIGGNGEDGDVVIRWHPGGGRHGPGRYWRVSSGKGKSPRIPAGEWDDPNSTVGGSGDDPCLESFSTVAGCGDPLGDLFGGDGDDPIPPGEIFEASANLFFSNPCVETHAASA